MHAQRLLIRKIENMLEINSMAWYDTNRKIFLYLLNEKEHYNGK